MNETSNKSQKNGKKILKKYILHQKVNPRLLGVNLFESNLSTPNEAYLSCKLFFKEDIQSLTELEQIVSKVQVVWAEKNHVLHIKKINVFTSAAYIVLTFTIGFFEQEQVVHLRELKQCVKEFVENYNNYIKEEQEAEYKRKEAEISGVIERCNQLTEKLEGLENRLIKNESIVLDSGELLKTELTKVSKTIKDQMDQTENKIKITQETNQPKLQTTRKTVEKKISLNSTYEMKRKESPKKIKPIQKQLFNRNQTVSAVPEINEWPIASKQFRLKCVENEKSNKKNFFPRVASDLEIEILNCFTETKELHKKRMIPKKQFLALKARVEFIDYLWMLLELDGKEEIIVAGKLSCRQLVEELGQVLESADAVVTSSTILNYWVYCSQELLLKLNGYAALKDFLNRSLKVPL